SRRRPRATRPPIIFICTRENLNTANAAGRTTTKTIPKRSSLSNRRSRAIRILPWLIASSDACTSTPPGREKISRASCSSARACVEKALQIAPDLGEAHLAQGIYFADGLHDYRRALTEFAIARRAS